MLKTIYIKNLQEHSKNHQLKCVYVDENKEQLVNLIN